MIKSTWKKAMCIGLSLLMVAGTLTAAPKKKKGDNPFKNQPKEKNSKNKVWNFKDMNVIVADWWTAEDIPDPVSQAEEDQRAWQDWIQETYKFTMRNLGISSWNAHPQNVANFCTTGGEENYVFVIDGRSAGPGLKANLFYDLSKVTSIDWSKDKWDQATKQKLSKGSSFYAMRAISPEPRGGVFFNKRLLQEAGIDPDSIYDMQANGTWTWETFEEMCKKCTRDLDNDGVNDIYAMASLSTEFCYLALDSNSASLIGRGADGKLFNNAGSDNSMEAWNWIRHMVDNYEMPSPEGANWDWMYTAFANGETAFTIDQEYTVQVGGRYHDMKDDYGFVCFPMGPKGDGKYKTLHDDNMYIIPGSYDDETAQNIAKAFDLWTDPVPGYEGSDTWKESYYPMFRDERAVDETLALMLENANPRFDTLVAGFNAGSFVWNFWGGWATPQEQYEATKNEWQALINDANR
jgi:hypothetical protein